MRIALYYLLIPCLFLLKGWQPGLAGMQQHADSAKTISAGKTVISTLPENDEDQPLFVVNDAEDDDDDFSTTKKRSNTCFAGMSFEDWASLSGLSAYSNNNNRFYKHFSYLSSRKFILHREIII